MAAAEVTAADNGPDGEALDTRPPWCGQCDRRTRLHERVDGRMERCQNCHPAPRKQLTQFTRCYGCKTITYSWDSNDCGSHLEIGKPIVVKGEVVKEKA